MYHTWLLALLTWVHGRRSRGNVLLLRGPRWGLIRFIAILIWHMLGPGIPLTYSLLESVSASNSLLLLLLLVVMVTVLSTVTRGSEGVSCGVTKGNVTITMNVGQRPVIIPVTPCEMDENLNYYLKYLYEFWSIIMMKLNRFFLWLTKVLTCYF